MLPSVTTKGTTDRRVISAPLINPSSALAATPASMASGTETACCSSCAVITDESAMLAPTERSMPPLTITKVIPIAHSPTITVCAAMVWKL